ncbi:hypothetical protein AVEN_128050-1 [Araneus ventricosus]|uniref:Pre-C2HC domain-containing protein n=1 Tax=Araneus ventricosus TaxID=182803 RepID=A0A4Y1ZZB8_ARAVE|nr:hypothetical protein AVEN_128050-1 [Araneus ventricosus]
MVSVDEVIALYGQCPVLNCTKHPPVVNSDARREVDASSCTDMETTRMADDPEQATTPPGEEKTEDDDFQMVLPRKAARETHLEKEATPVKTANMFKQLAEENIQKKVAKSILEINLKIMANCNLILKEISQHFPKTENRLRRDFIGIKADTEENREKIINFLKEKNLEFVLSKAQKDRPAKVVIRDLPIDIEIAEIIQSLEEKGYKIGRVSDEEIQRKETPFSLPD